MHCALKFLCFIWICALTKGNVIPETSNETVPEKHVNTPVKDDVAVTENKLREKRQLGYIPTTSPVFFDNAQQQSGLLGLGQNIPIVGTLVTGLPILGNGQNLLGGLTGNLGSGLNGLTSGLTSTLGNLGGGLGNLGQLGNVAGLGNLGLLGTAPTTTNAASCPASQKLSCRCEPLLPIKPLGVRKAQNNDVIEIEDQSIKNHVDGSTEIIARLSNGIVIYQKSNNQIISKEIEGYYSLKVTDERYLTIYFTINDLDYTVKAEVQSEPSKAEIEINGGHQNLLGSFL